MKPSKRQTTGDLELNFDLGDHVKETIEVSDVSTLESVEVTMKRDDGTVEKTFVHQRQRCQGRHRLADRGRLEQRLRRRRPL